MSKRKGANRNKLFVVAKCAQTLDGKIATSSRDSQWITSKKTRQFARKIRNQFDAILVGIETVICDNPKLAPANQKSYFKKIVLDSTLKISPQANLFKRIQSKNCVMATTTKASKAKRRFLEKKGVSVIECPAKNARVNMKWLFRKLYKLGVRKLLIEGGAQVVGCALKENLVDRVHVYVAPKILGDDTALSAVAGRKVKRIDQSIGLKNMAVKRIGPDLFIQADVYRDR